MDFEFILFYKDASDFADYSLENQSLKNEYYYLGDKIPKCNKFESDNYFYYIYEGVDIYFSNDVYYSLESTLVYLIYEKYSISPFNEFWYFKPFVKINYTQNDYNLLNQFFQINCVNNTIVELLTNNDENFDFIIIENSNDKELFKNLLLRSNLQFLNKDLNEKEIIDLINKIEDDVIITLRRRV